MHPPAHREYFSELLERGSLVACGPFAEDSGVRFFYEAGSAEVAAALAVKDPFATSGVFERCEFKPWKLVFSDTELLRGGG